MNFRLHNLEVFSGSEILDYVIHNTFFEKTNSGLHNPKAHLGFKKDFQIM